MSDKEVIFRNQVTRKYVKETDQESLTAETTVKKWTDINTEAQRFVYPILGETCPPINNVAGNKKWHAKKDAVSKQLLAMLAFQQRNQLEQLLVQEDAEVRDES